jgi:hypothetical protein
MGLLKPFDAPNDANPRSGEETKLRVVSQPENSDVYGSSGSRPVSDEKLGVYGSFDALPESYERLFREAGGKSFFFSRAWFENLAETTSRPNEKIHIAGLETAEHDATPLACLILRSPAGQKGSIFAGRRFGGHSLAGLTSHPTTLFSPLISESVADPNAVLSRLINGIQSQSPSCSVFDLNRMDAQSPLFFGLIQALRAQGFCVRPYKYCDLPYETVSGISFERYFNKRAQRMRSDLRRRLRKLEKSHGVAFRIISGTEGIDEAIEAFERVNAASWRQPEPFPDFDAGFLRAAAAEGVLRFGMLDVDGETVAVQIWIVNGGLATGTKLAFDERFKKDHVGALLMLHTIAHVIDQDRVDEIDFGLYANDYKRRWLSQQREIWGIAAFHPRTRAGLAALLRYDAREALARILSIGRRGERAAKLALAKLPRIKLRKR